MIEQLQKLASFCYKEILLKKTLAIFLPIDFSSLIAKYIVNKSIGNF